MALRQDETYSQNGGFCSWPPLPAQGCPYKRERGGECHKIFPPAGTIHPNGNGVKVDLIGRLWLLKRDSLDPTIASSFTCPCP
jgi:hypothetical protein